MNCLQIEFWDDSHDKKDLAKTLLARNKYFQH